MSEVKVSDIKTAVHCCDWLCDRALIAVRSDFERESVEAVRKSALDFRAYRHLLPDLCGPFGRVNVASYDERVCRALTILTRQAPINPRHKQ